MTRRDRVVEGSGALDHDSFNLDLFYFQRKIVKFNGLVDGPGQSIGIIILEKKAVTRIAIAVHVDDRIVDSAGIVCHRQGSVYGADHLRQTAWFKTRRHQHKIRGAVCQPGQSLVKVTNRHPPVQVVELHDFFEILLKFYLELQCYFQYILIRYTFAFHS